MSKEALPHSSGIYCVAFKEVENLVYIGKASDLYNRYQSHLSKLRHEKHPNYKLQKFYNLYGIPIFSVIEEVPTSTLCDRELHWIKEYDSYHNGLNLTPGGEGQPNGEEHPNALYSSNVYSSILLELAYTDKTAKSIAEDLNVSISVVRDISCLTTHTYLQEAYPQAYLLLKNKLGKRVSGSSCAKDRGIIYPLIRQLHSFVPVRVDNLSKFCRDNNLDSRALTRLFKGESKTHKGWRLYNV